MVDVPGLPLDVPVTDLIATFTPLVAGCILVYKAEGIHGVKRLLKRVLDFSRIRRKIWHLPVIFFDACPLRIDLWRDVRVEPATACRL